MLHIPSYIVDTKTADNIQHGTSQVISEGVLDMLASRADPLKALCAYLGVALTICLKQ